MTIPVSEEPTGTWLVWGHDRSGQRVLVESDLPEEVARQMIADYAVEGVTVWMEQTATAPE